MNLIVEEKPNCEAVLSVYIPAEELQSAREKIVRSLQRAAKVPGFRPGKTPRPMIEKMFAKEIESELISNQVRTVPAAAQKQHGLTLLRITEVTDVLFSPHGDLSFKASAVLEPSFELPDYNHLEISIPSVEITEEKVQEGMDRLREPHASYIAVEDRPLATGDFAVISYISKIDGKPLSESVPTAPPLLKERKNTWLEIGGQPFLPGFEEQILGMTPGTTRIVKVQIPENHPTEVLRGKTIEIETTLHQIHQRILPEWTDELAEKVHPGKTVDEIRSLVREKLEQSVKRELENLKRQLVVQRVVEKVTCDLPHCVVNNEMRGILEEIVAENQARGVSPEELYSQEEQILGYARQSAERNARARFVLLKIADRENLQVTEQHVLLYILNLAQRLNIPPKKLLADLKKRNALPRVYEDLRVSRVVDFLVQKTTFVTQPAAD